MFIFASSTRQARTAGKNSDCVNLSQKMVMKARNADVTALLRAWSDGDEAAIEQLAPIVFSELKRLAHRHLANERPNHTLESGALVNEAYVRLVDWKNVRWQNRAHFFAAAAQMMRRILVDYARARGYQKRGGEFQKVALDESAIVSPGRSSMVVALDEALQKLALKDPRKSRVVELRYFGGLTTDEIAEVLKVSSNTVLNDWAMARAWLIREIDRSGR